jgi:hypothetical protein
VITAVIIFASVGLMILWLAGPPEYGEGMATAIARKIGAICLVASFASFAAKTIIEINR